MRGAWLFVLLLGAADGFHAAAVSPLHFLARQRHFVARQRQPTLAFRDAVDSFKADLDSDDWDYYQSARPWTHPNFFTCMITALSVQQALALGLFQTFGIGPLLVLSSSVVHWANPQRDSWRRALDVATVRLGMSSQVLIASLQCYQHHLPILGVGLLLAGYGLALPCYVRRASPPTQRPRLPRAERSTAAGSRPRSQAVGRILSVRGQPLRGAWVHGGLHLFSNVGNLLMLRLVSM